MEQICKFLSVLYYIFRWGLGFFDQAYDSDGNKLDVVKIDSKVLPATFYYGTKITPTQTREIFAIDLSREYLDRAKSKGLDIKAIGKRG
jgi:hypothetical protein